MAIADQIRLHISSGFVQMDPIHVDPSDRKIIGRGSAADVTLKDEAGSISRKHLEIAVENDQWVVRDLGSRNGTLLDGKQLTSHEPSTIVHGSVLLMGNWELRVLSSDSPDERSQSQSTLVDIQEDPVDLNQRFERVQDEPLAELASHRLATLLECSDSIHSCETLTQASEVAIDAMLNSTGYTRGAYVRIPDESDVLETLVFRSRNPLETVDSVRFSRSLLRIASGGDVVRVSSSGSTQNYGQSIAELDIHSALCIPVMIGESAAGFLYLDARGSEHLVSHDSSSFGRAIGNLLASTAANLRNMELEIQRVSMQFDLDAAGSAQRMLLPEPEGAVGCLSYSMSMLPGRSVAGDLFGLVPLQDGRVCAFLGDVSGKGAGAAIMMATTQSYLHALLEDSTDLAQVVNKLNRHLAGRSLGNTFVTMWIGVLSPMNEENRSDVTFIDAGHGHWLITRTGLPAIQPEYKGGTVLGIVPDYQYTTETFSLEKDQRLVLFSDGIVEQIDPEENSEFGIDRAKNMLSSSTDTTEDVDVLLRSVIDYAKSDQLNDDTTVASIGFVGNAGPD